MTEYVPMVNLVLNLFLLPTLWLIWGIKVELAKMNGRLATVEWRAGAAEHRIEHLENGKS